MIFYYSKERDQIIELSEDKKIFVYKPILSDQVPSPAIVKKKGRPVGYKVEKKVEPVTKDDSDILEHLSFGKKKMISEYGKTTVNKVIDMHLIGSAIEDIAVATRIPVRDAELIIENCI